MTVSIRNSRISGADTGVRVAGKVGVDIDGLTINRTKTAYDISSQQPNIKGDNRDKEWHERPIGRISLGVLISVIGAALIGAAKIFIGA